MIIIDQQISEILTLFDKKSKIVLDTNMYIFNYRYIMELYPKYNCFEKTKIETVGFIFKYLEDKQIPVIIPKIIHNEIKKKMTEFNYQYNNEIIFGNLNINEDKDDFFEIENRPLAQKLFYESSTDLMIYIYCKDKKIQIIITDNVGDYYESEKIYEKNINPNGIKVIITGIVETHKIINNHS